MSLQAAPAALIILTAAAPALAANLTHFTNEADFLAANGTTIVEDYEGLGNQQNSDDAMNAYYAQTVYETTAGSVTHQTWNGYYNATNASFRLHFDQTSITDAGGVHAVATSFASYDHRWVYFLRFADGTTAELELPEANLGSEAFVGFSSDVPIVSLHMCVTGDTAGILNGTFWLDTLTLAAAPTPPCVADLDADNDTDVFDFNIFAPAFGTSLGDPGYVPAADLNDDDTIDVFDFNIFAPDFGCSN